MSDTTRQKRRGATPATRPTPAQVIDPTENVLALVDAETRYLRDMLVAETRRQDDLRHAETRRINDLEVQRVRYETQMGDVLTVQVKTTSDLISAQLDKTTTSLGNLITTAVNSLNDRIALLERFRYEVGGMTTQRGESRQNIGLILALGMFGAAAVSAAVALAWHGHP